MEDAPKFTTWTPSREADQIMDPFTAMEARVSALGENVVVVSMEPSA